MESKEPDLVVVRWNDAWVDGNDPVNIADAAVTHKPKVIVTLGWALKYDEMGISIANEHYADEGVYRGRTFIPRAMIVSVTPVKLVKPRKPKNAINPTVTPTD